MVSQRNYKKAYPQKGHPGADIRPLHSLHGLDHLGPLRCMASSLRKPYYEGIAHNCTTNVGVMKKTSQEFLTVAPPPNSLSEKTGLRLEGLKASWASYGIAWCQVMVSLAIVGDSEAINPRLVMVRISASLPYASCDFNK